MLPDNLIGPPVPEAPWGRHGFVQPWGGRSSAGVLPGVTTLTGKPYVAPVMSADQTTTRFTEKISALVNSLLAKGHLALVGVSDFSIHTGSFEAARPPAATDDSSTGVVRGSAWVDTAAGRVYFCVTSTVGAAIWRGPY